MTDQTPIDVADLAVEQMRAARRLDAAKAAYHAVDRDRWRSPEADELAAARKAMRAAQKAYDAACGEAVDQLVDPAPPAEQEDLFG